MVQALADLGLAFVLGLLTPLTAVCVLPLYPGFLSYLSSKASGRTSIFRFGLIITSGVLLFMMFMGLVFTTILQVSLTTVIGIVSPVAFAILGAISVLLIFDVDLSRFLPKMSAPVSSNPFTSSFSFGFFFGAIVVPCNPLFIAALFARSVMVAGFLANMLSFLAFGFGIAFPLLAFSAVSTGRSSQVIGFLSSQKKRINLISGFAMLTISIYYLVFVFRLLG